MSNDNLIAVINYICRKGNYKIKHQQFNINEKPYNYDKETFKIIYMKLYIVLMTYIDNNQDIQIFKLYNFDNINQDNIYKLIYKYIKDFCIFSKYLIKYFNNRNIRKSIEKQKENLISINEIGEIKDLLNEKIYILIGLFKKLFSISSNRLNIDNYKEIIKKYDYNTIFNETLKKINKKTSNTTPTTINIKYLEIDKGEEIIIN
jgi:hypothetical protein